MNIRFSMIIVLAMMIVFVSIPAEAQAEEIKLVIDSQNVESKLLIVDGRSLVSAQILKEKFGEKLVWKKGRKELQVNSGYWRASFQVGSRIAEVNSSILPLESRIRLINDDVMIPLRFLTKMYGGELEWDGSTKTIYYYSNRVSDISTKSSVNSSQVVINTDYQVKYELNLYHRPQRLVLDLYNVSLAEVKSKVEVNNNIIRQIRVSQFKLNPAVVRVVVDINQMSNYQIKRNSLGLVLKINQDTQVVTSSIISRKPKLKKPKLKLRTKKIVIDPGHGGFDPGAIGPSGVQEKTVNYQIAKSVNKLLKQAGFRTKMTRRSDKFYSLAKRANQANRWSADLFVSIHSNSNSKPWINGTATYAHWYASKSNWALAWYVQSELVERIKLESNGLKAANFAVLRETNMPAILVETAFLSNPREERLLNSDDFQQKAAAGIVAGIKKYFAKED
ncbi:N-acetylmuramoyl-L-alanine amidase [Halobacteroides halobius DSM 5150]|uniref:N-acetylmuramoyl-L-alanine amidase n=1 Tax=Halobacteroides halobius (strain ATCC 35273 / DSM 5150 / MD-1) TaxID=748449 RepID=L0K5B7_HALHC|nr:N-acetylmuramoyl-L-alanine amidase family protein [Halobacteroides halobius]AGB40467.1 N-acetylmuramoyl-L-alanine amidase [Halobacteroides halobius DSM 5150]